MQDKTRIRSLESSAAKIAAAMEKAEALQREQLEISKAHLELYRAYMAHVMEPKSKVTSSVTAIFSDLKECIATLKWIHKKGNGK